MLLTTCIKMEYLTGTGDQCLCNQIRSEQWRKYLLERVQQDLFPSLTRATSIRAFKEKSDLDRAFKENLNKSDFYQAVKGKNDLDRPLKRKFKQK